MQRYTLMGGDGHAVVEGGSGSDVLSGGSGSDDIFDGEDNDEIYEGSLVRHIPPAFISAGYIVISSGVRNP